jgi:hypothetical protein
MASLLKGKRKADAGGKVSWMTPNGPLQLYYSPRDRAADDISVRILQDDAPVETEAALSSTSTSIAYLKVLKDYSLLME